MLYIANIQSVRYYSANTIYGYISGFWDIRAAKNKKSYSKMKENR